MTEIILNGCVISLLLITIWYCWRLNNKIAELKNSERDMHGLVKTFDIAIQKTHKNISDLKEMSSSSTIELQNYLEKANELVSDLSFMTETASKLADRLERGIMDSRGLRNDNIEKFRSDHLENMISNLGKNISIDNDNEKAEKSNSNYTKTRDDLLKAIKIARQNS